jgi:hypothetical protein
LLAGDDPNLPALDYKWPSDFSLLKIKVSITAQNFKTHKNNLQDFLIRRELKGRATFYPALSLSHLERITFQTPFESKIRQYFTDEIDTFFIGITT